MQGEPSAAGVTRGVREVSNMNASVVRPRWAGCSAASAMADSYVAVSGPCGVMQRCKLAPPAQQQQQQQHGRVTQRHTVHTVRTLLPCVPRCAGQTYSCTGSIDVHTTSFLTQLKHVLCCADVADVDSRSN